MSRKNSVNTGMGGGILGNTNFDNLPSQQKIVRVIQSYKKDMNSGCLRGSQDYQEGTLTSKDFMSPSQSNLISYRVEDQKFAERVMAAKNLQSREASDINSQFSYHEGSHKDNISQRYFQKSHISQITANHPNE